MAEPRTVDVVVIGAGAVGENVAARVARAGLGVVLVEDELVGGECSYWACMPSKALLRSGHVLAAAQRVDGAKQAVTGSLEARAVLDRRTSFTHNWDDSSQVRWADGAGIEVLRGRAQITGERRVAVATKGGADELLEARHAVAACTGSTPTAPPIDGLDSVPYWTSRDATSAREVPRRLVVLGGGVVGAELSQAWRRLGSEVVLVSDSVLKRAEPFAGELVTEALRSEGVEVLTDARTTRAWQDGGDFVLLVDGREIRGDRLLVATGRRPATDDLGLETLGLQPGKALVTDDSGRVTGVDGGWLYAAGDVTGRAPLTHQGKYAARATGDAIAARAQGRLGDEVAPWSAYAATADHTAVPQVVFTDPEVAWVGRTEQQAREAGIDVRVVDYALGDVAGASLHADGYAGRARMVVDESRARLVGATFVGQDVAEMVHAATVAVVGEVPLHRLWHAVPSYPTMSEVWLRLLEEYGL